MIFGVIEEDFSQLILEEDEIMWKDEEIRQQEEPTKSYQLTYTSSVPK